MTHTNYAPARLADYSTPVLVRARVQREPSYQLVLPLVHPAWSFWGLGEKVGTHWVTYLNDQEEGVGGAGWVHYKKTGIITVLYMAGDEWGRGGVVPYLPGQGEGRGRELQMSHLPDRGRVGWGRGRGGVSPLPI